MRPEYKSFMKKKNSELSPEELAEKQKYYREWNESRKKRLAGGQASESKGVQKKAKNTPKEEGFRKGHGGNGMVNGQDLLDHPDVPDQVKDKIRAAGGDLLAPSEPTTKGKRPPAIKNHQHVNNMPGAGHCNKSQEITIRFDTSPLETILAEYVGKIREVPPPAAVEPAPLPAPIDLTPVMDILDQTNTHLAEIIQRIPAPSGPVDLTPVLDAITQVNTHLAGLGKDPAASKPAPGLEKALDKIAILLGTISREVQRIAEKVDPPPKNSVGHVMLKEDHGPPVKPEKNPVVFARMVRAENGHKFPGLVKVLGTRGPLIQVKDLTVSDSKPVWREGRNFEIVPEAPEVSG